MQYRILVDNNAASLSKRIEGALESDWELAGGIALASIGHSVIFAQAITNQEDAPVPVPVDDRTLSEIIEEALREIGHPQA